MQNVNTIIEKKMASIWVNLLFCVYFLILLFIFKKLELTLFYNRVVYYHIRIFLILLPHPVCHHITYTYYSYAHCDFFPLSWLVQILYFVQRLIQLLLRSHVQVIFCAIFLFAAWSIHPVSILPIFVSNILLFYYLSLLLCCFTVFFVKWPIKLHGLFNAKAILVK